MNLDLLPCGPAGRHLLMVAGGILALLVMASLAGRILRRRSAHLGEDVIRRTRAWWAMALVIVGALVAGRIATVVLFGLISFLALREFITLAPTRRADHRSLFWAFFVILPMQYVAIGIGWTGLAMILIPVWAFLFLAIRSTFAGDATNYLERAAKIHWGLMLCGFCLAHLPMLLWLPAPGFAGRQAELLLWLILVVQLGDVFQYVWGKAIGRRKVAPHLSPNKTWEGLIGGILTASGLGAALWWLTPFAPWQAFLMALFATGLGFAGGVVMSAIKRDSGVKDFGHLLPGHGGILDRVDSLTFAAPAVFHLCRYCWT